MLLVGVVALWANIGMAKQSFHHEVACSSFEFRRRGDGRYGDRDAWHQHRELRPHHVVEPSDQDRYGVPTEELR
ncbi:hypothetical protein [Mycobacterium sp. 050134]|uniref:hypothetical protein n=1 Tax=Mycobacterium sp. 050134 TaxID=3096111 RepID=UPI002ED795FD